MEKQIVCDPIHYRRPAFELQFRTRPDFPMVHGFARETVRPDNYASARVQAAWENWCAAIDDMHNTPKVADSKPYHAVVLRSLRALVSSYVRKDSTIAMVCADEPANPAVREAWETVADWLTVSTLREVHDDLTAIRAVTGSVTNVTNLVPGSAKFKFPMKKIRKAVREEIRREFSRTTVDVEFDPACLGLVKLEAVGYVKREDAAAYVDLDADEFNGSNGDPSVVITVPTMHDGQGGHAVTRFTGVIENEHSGERWLVNTKIDGKTNTPFVREADVSRIPD